MKQAERLVRRDELRAEIAKREAELETLRDELARLLADCEHTYADGRHATAGGSVKLCALCGRVLKGREEKLWG